MNRQEWLKKYRTNKKAIWINVRLTNGQEFYNDKFEGWRSVKQLCDDKKLFIEELSLQFRSHEVKIDIPDDADGFYLIRSVQGKMGGKTTNYYTTGIVKDFTVYKKMWIVPELIVEKEVEDNLADCFEEAIIYDQRKNGKK